MSVEAKDARRADSLEMGLKAVNSLLQSHGPRKSLCLWWHAADNFANFFVHINDHFHIWLTVAHCKGRASEDPQLCARGP